MQIALRRENCNFDGVLQKKWGSAETTTGIHVQGILLRKTFYASLVLLPLQCETSLHGYLSLGNT